MMRESSECARIVRQLHECFPADPIPPYPENFGLDPLGNDEYAGFANRPWPAVEPRHLSCLGYDICAAIGFGLQRPPHLLSYYAPAFMTGALLHEGEDGIEILDSFLWRLRELRPGLGPVDSALPWWHGGSCFGNYSAAQCDGVIDWLEFVRRHGNEAPLWFDWELPDELTLQAFGARRALLTDRV